MSNVKHLLEHLTVCWFVAVLFVASGAYFIPFNLSSLLFIGVPFIFGSYLLSPYYILDNKYVLLFLILVSLLYLGVLYSGAPSYGYFKFSIFSIYIGIFIATYKTLVKRSDLFILYGVLVGVVFILLVIINFKDPVTYLIAMRNQELRLGLDSQERENLNPIWIARCMGFVIICCLFFRSHGALTIIKYCLILASTIYILATASKGPILSLIIALFLSRFGLSFRSSIIAIVVIGLLLIMFNSLLINVVDNDFLVKRFSVGNNAAVAERIDFINEVVSRVSFVNSFFGTGTGNSAIVIENVDMRAYPHNIFLEVFFENGLFALLIVCTMFIQGYKMINRYPNDLYFRFWLCLFCFFSLNSLVSGDLPSNQFLFLSFLCLCQYFNKINNYKSRASIKYS